MTSSQAFPKKLLKKNFLFIKYYQDTEDLLKCICIEKMCFARARSREKYDRLVHKPLSIKPRFQLPINSRAGFGHALKAMLSLAAKGGLCRCKKHPKRHAVALIAVQKARYGHYRKSALENAFLAAALLEIACLMCCCQRQCTPNGTSPVGLKIGQVLNGSDGCSAVVQVCIRVTQASQQLGQGCSRKRTQAVVLLSCWLGVECCQQREGLHTMKVESTAKVLAKRTLKYCTISWC